MGKGPEFEREVPEELSLWWSHGRDEDIFWRKDSGARAKTRARKGKHTFGAHGDVVAVNPVGLPLTNVCTLELKRGYKKWSPLDVLDRPPMRKGQKNRALQPFEEFVQQVQEDAEFVGTFPVILAKRDKRQKIISLPEPLFEDILKYTGTQKQDLPPTLSLDIDGVLMYKFVTMRFYDFLSWCPPEYFKERDEWASSTKSQRRRRRR